MKKIIYLLVLVGLGLLFMIYNKNHSKDHYTYVITETAIANSFDPLDADQTINLPVARMLYSTPIEININGELTSKILDQFEYDEQNKAVTWKVKTGITYSDGG